MNCYHVFQLKLNEFTRFLIKYLSNQLNCFVVNDEETEGFYQNKEEEFNLMDFLKRWRSCLFSTLLYVGYL